MYYLYNNYNSNDEDAQKNFLPNITFSEPIYYIEPTPLYFKPNPTYNYISLKLTPDGKNKCIYISELLTTYLSSTTNLSLKKYSITNSNNIVANLVNNNNDPYITVTYTNEPQPDPNNISIQTKSFKFNAYQQFYQNYNQNISYLPTSLSVTITIN